MNSDSTPPPMEWFDAHLDLACLAVEGRRLTCAPAEAGGPPQPAAVSLPSLAAGNVRLACATIFTGAGENGPCGYPALDGHAARAAALKQLEVYRRLEEAGDIALIRAPRDLENRAGGSDTSTGPLSAILLMEGADPIADPDDAAWWFECGVRAVGLTWARGTRYAGGNAAPGPLTSAGRALARRLDALGVIHDLSHLSDEGARELLDLVAGPVMASHSNLRRLVDGASQRHLPDDLVKSIGARGGMIGLNLYSRFLTPDGGSRRASIAEAIDHVIAICDLVERRDLVGLGSDMDGGFGADQLPDGIDRPADLVRLADELLARGWSDEDVRGFAHANWLQFFSHSLSS